LSDIWTYELARGTAARVTTKGENVFPLWTLDGKRILFAGGPGLTQILSIMADGQGPTETVPTGKYPIASSFSPDGKWLAYLDGGEIWIRSTSGQGEAKLFLQSKFRLFDAEFSPDGKWMAYSSNESGAQRSLRPLLPRPW
jgi:Tol biopolymer transport system component